MKDNIYYFHQTPEELCKQLIKYVPLHDGDMVLEPFKGEGSFFNNFPNNTINDYCEIEEGLDFKDYDKPIDWVISNPPFKLETGTKHVNSFYYLLDYYLSRVNKGIAFLGNDRCFSTLTPKRIKSINDKGFYIQKIVVCSIKKWRGRYFFIIITKEPNDFYNCIEGNF
jgi:hypothetical protein